MKYPQRVALALLCGLSLSCGGTLPTALRADSRLVVFVNWQGRGLAGRQLEIVDLGLVRTTDGGGIAVFGLPAGSHTLRAYVNAGGPPRSSDVSVATRRGETERVEIVDCLPCVSAR